MYSNQCSERRRESYKRYNLHLAEVFRIEYCISDESCKVYLKNPQNCLIYIKAMILERTSADLCSSLILSEKLYPHLLEIDRAEQERMDAMLPRMMEAAGVTEELKARDPMRWAGLMNTLKAQVKEVIRLEKAKPNGAFSN